MCGYANQAHSPGEEVSDKRCCPANKATAAKLLFESVGSSLIIAKSKVSTALFYSNFSIEDFLNYELKIESHFSKLRKKNYKTDRIFFIFVKFGDNLNL